MTRPDKFPEWAMIDVEDTVVYENNLFKINNVIEPPAEKKTAGWGYKDIAIRNWMNWLGRTTCQWLQYLDAPALHTVATLPSNMDNPIGKMIYVSDESGGATLAFNDGTNWRRITDRAIVS
jgi:hypothetical protein